MSEKISLDSSALYTQSLREDGLYGHLPFQHSLMHLVCTELCLKA